MAEAATKPTDFPATRWTLVAAAAGPESGSALGRIYEIYRTPVRAQARRFGVPEDDVEDVVQELFLSLIRSGAIGRADPCRGRFRSFLLGALRNHISHRRAHDRALRRGGGQPTDSLYSPGAQPPAVDCAESGEYDAQWARALFAEAARRLRNEEAPAGVASPTFAALGGAVLGGEEISYEDAARRLEITMPAVKSRLFRLRGRFREIVREEVARTVSTEAECDDELRYLCGVLDRCGTSARPRS